MKLNLPEKYISQSWLKWFIEALRFNDFVKVGPNNFKFEAIEVRIFRPQKQYQVLVDGVMIATDLNFTFPQLTQQLHP